MADVILKNIDGENVVYEDVTKVSLDTADGGIATFTLGGGGVAFVDYEQSDPSADDYIKNRPFYEDEINIEWDGTVDESTFTGYDPSWSNYTTTIQKVSDMTFSEEELNKLTLAYINPYNNSVNSLVIGGSHNITEINLLTENLMSVRSYDFCTGHIVFIALEDGVSYEINSTKKLVFPTKGTYFAHVVENTTNQIRATKLSGKVLKQIDTKFLPDSIATDADVTAAVANKVDKVTGKGLSTNDFTNDYKTTLDTLKTDLNAGKKLSTNDFTNEYKEKIDNAQVVQSDYNQSNATADDYIKNRPFSEDYWTIIEENAKFVGNSSNNVEYTFWFWFELTGALSKGRNYDITIDGESYRLTCNSYATSDNENTLVIGNAYEAFQVLDLTTTSTVVNSGESFAIIQTENTQGVAWVMFDDTEQTEHNVKLVLNDVKKIDKKFLPDDLVTEATNGLPSVTSTDNGKIMKVVNGTWQLSEDEKGSSENVGRALPEVTTNDNNKILKVVDGTWQLADGETTVAMEEIDIFPEQEVTTYLNSTFNKYQWGNTDAFILEDGEEYIIEYDGEVYTCVASPMTAGTMTGIGAGNQGILGIGDDTGEPFLVGYLNESNFAGVFNNDTADTKHTLRIYQLKESSSTEFDGTISWNNITDKPFFEEVIDFTYDGNHENYDYIEVGGIYMIKVSDYPLSKTEIIDSTVVINGETIIISAAQLSDVMPTVYVFTPSDSEIPFITIVSEDTTDGGITVSKGTYIYDLSKDASGMMSGMYVSSFKTASPILKKIDEKFVPDVEWNNIKNNPLVNETIVLTEKFSENDLAFTYISDLEMAGWSVQENRFSFIQKGKEYIVNFDGTEYKCIAKEVTTSNNMTGLYLGNLSIANIALNATNEDTGEPFMIDNLNHYTEISTKDTENTTHTVSISSEEIKYELIQLDWDETDQSSPAYIKNKPLIGADGTVTVQSNWNQSDNTQGDYIKNRPFYDYTVEENIFNQTVEGFTFQEEFNSYMVATKPAPFVLKIDKEYIVTFDGEEFTLTPFYFEFNGYTHVCVGDKVLTGVPSTGEEFALVYNEATGYMNYFSFSTATSHTISIIEKGIEVKQIDEKYIPESARGIQPDWSIDDTTSKSHILNRPFYGKEVEVLPLITCDMVTTNEPQYGFNMSHSFLEDNSYKVIWDDVEYICPVQKIEADGASPTYVLGNFYEYISMIELIGQILPIDKSTLLQNNEPFLIMCEEYEGSMQYGVVDLIKGKEFFDAMINTGDTSSVVYVNHTLKINHLNIKTLDPIYLPTDLQVDWNYLKHKPFYEQTEKTPLLNNITLNFEYVGEFIEGTGKIVSMYEESNLSVDMIALINDSKYNKVEVIIDGTLYESELQYYSGMRCAGNMQIMLGSGDTGEPFIIGSQDTAFMIMYLNETTDHEVGEAIPHTISLTFISENIKKINPKFVYQPDWNDIDKKSGSYIHNKPFGLKGDLLLDMNVVAIQRQEQSGFIMNMGLGQYVGLVVGETYTVSIDDGEKYVLVAESSGENTIILSNAGSDYFEGAFMLQESLSESMMGLMWLVDSSSASTSCNLKIYKGTVEIQKIPIEYLPDDVGGMPNASAEDEGKFMRVIGGQAVWATVLNAEEVKF